MRTLAIPVMVPVLLAFCIAVLLLFVLAGAGTAPSVGEPSEQALADIPAAYLELYVKAGKDYRTDWWVLAAIGKVETNHGRSTLPGIHSGVNAYGCCAGPMQFAVGPQLGCRICVGDTWGAYGVDGNGDGVKNVYDPADAIPAAARYTRANGAPRDWHRALRRYNNSEAYFAEVMDWANRYRAAQLGAVTGPLDPALAAALNISTAGLKPAAIAELRNANSWGLHLISGYRQDPLPEHPSGLAIDVSNGLLTPQMAAYAESLRARGSAGAPIHGVIYNNRITGYGGWTWRDYGSGHSGNATQDHKDHVHVWLS